MNIRSVRFDRSGFLGLVSGHASGKVANPGMGWPEVRITGIECSNGRLGCLEGDLPVVASLGKAYRAAGTDREARRPE